MNTGTDEFDKLRKVLKLKRYEQPPPGYFNHFSSLVINRIEKEAKRRGSWLELRWLRKLSRMFESSPAAAGLFASALCALVVFGITAANRMDQTPAMAFQPADSTQVTSTAPAPMAVNADSRYQSLGRSTDPMFGSIALSSPSGGNGGLAARIENVSFSPSTR